MYVESVGPALGRGLRHWTQTVAADAAPVEQLHLPHGGVEIRWHRGRPPVVVGPSTMPSVEVIRPGDDVVGVRFSPGRWSGRAGPALGDLVDSVHPLATIAGLSFGDDDAPAETRSAHLRRVVAGLEPPSFGDPVLASVGDVHQRDLSSRDVAITTGWSQRHVRRQIQHVTGLTVRDLRRLGRFQRFVSLVQGDVASRRRRSPVELAVAAGYSDQSHLQRTCRRLAGLTLADYLDRTHHHCAGHDHSSGATFR